MERTSYVIVEMDLETANNLADCFIELAPNVKRNDIPKNLQPEHLFSFAIKSLETNEFVGVASLGGDQIDHTLELMDMEFEDLSNDIAMELLIQAIFAKASLDGFEKIKTPCGGTYYIHNLN